MSARHTSGPWMVERSDGMVWIGRKKAFSDKVGDVITGISYGNEYSDEYNERVLADAHLIAAAPDLLKSESKLAAEVGGLKAFEDEVRAVIGNTNWNVLMQRLDESYAAIAKAEGRSNG